MQTQPNRTEEHHLNLGGMAGQQRRGDDFSVPLCEYHHRAAPITGWSYSEMRKLFGPSLAKESKAFRETYGSDDDLLLDTNMKLAGLF